MAVMANKKNNPKARRRGAPLNIWIPEDLKDLLNDYVERSRPPLTAKAIVQTALEDYFQKLGLWSPETGCQPPPAKPAR